MAPMDHTTLSSPSEKLYSLVLLVNQLTIMLKICLGYALPPSILYILEE